MKKIFTIILLIPTLIFAQENGGMECSAGKMRAYAAAKTRISSAAYPGDPNINVIYHKISLDIKHTTKSIVANVITDFKPLSDINTCSFNLKNALKVDSIKFKNKKTEFTHTNNIIKINFTETLKAQSLQTVQIFYNGVPPTSAFGSFSSSTHGAAKAPVVWTLSESYGAPDWWPCKDDLTDKIDSSEVSITMDPLFVSVSNGVLVSEKTNTNNTKTYTWKNKYPIAHYLISIACSNYTVYEKPFNYNGKTMPVTHYIYPEILTNNIKTQLDQTNDMLKFFSDKFGEYPFINEKYGHAMCNFGGGMEHQTVSSMGGFNESLIAHELAHQWFGDKITCKTWADIFVNEAFASYSEALFDEFKYNKARYLTTINGHIERAKKVTETVYIARPEDENLIFNYALTYGKGAVVLHMLRGVLGDEIFFKSLKNYMASNMVYGVATIDDFKIIAEKTSGKDLKYFFDEWIYGTNYPKYTMGWEATGLNNVKVNISQTKLSTTPSIFKMPIHLKMNYADGKDTTVTAFMDEESKSFIFNNLKSIPKTIDFDPNSWIMKEILNKGRTELLANEPIENSNVYPNPSSDYVNIKTKSKNYDAIHLLDNKGMAVKNYSGYLKKINVENLPSGIYYIQIINKTQIIETQKFIKN